MHEHELIRRSREGDETAFKELLEKYHSKIFYHCLSIVKNESTAEDVTQETFLKAYHHLPTFREDSSFYTWIYRIAHNLSLNTLKKTKVAVPYRDEIGLPSKEEPLEIEEKIVAAVQQLDEPHRIVFELYEFEHLPQKEIAAKLNIPFGTVRSRLFYARKKIRTILGA